MNWTQPDRLEGELVRLRPLVPDDAESLQPLLDLETFRYFVSIQPASTDLAGSKLFVTELLMEPRTQPFLIELKANQKPIGITTYMDIREPHRSLEIGMTWIIAEHRGTRANPEMKYLMLRHAFENWGCVRVQLKTDGRNEHSQAAIAKLGAKYEGTLRKHSIQPNGYIRDTVMYSITDEEWPSVKRGLEERLSLLPA